MDAAIVVPVHLHTMFGVHIVFLCGYESSGAVLVPLILRTVIHIRAIRHARFESAIEKILDVRAVRHAESVEFDRLETTYFAIDVNDGSHTMTLAIECRLQYLVMWAMCWKELANDKAFQNSFPYESRQHRKVFACECKCVVGVHIVLVPDSV